MLHIFDWQIFNYFLQLIFRLTPLASAAKSNEKLVNQTYATLFLSWMPFRRNKMSTKYATIFTIIICTFAFDFASSLKTDCIQIIVNVHVDPGSLRGQKGVKLDI